MAFEFLLPAKGQVGVGLVSFCSDHLELTWSIIIPLFVKQNAGGQVGQSVLPMAAESNISACNVQV
jgi:hypothetical protein